MSHTYDLTKPTRSRPCIGCGVATRTASGYCRPCNPELRPCDGCGSPTTRPTLCTGCADKIKCDVCGLRVSGSRYSATGRCRVCTHLDYTDDHALIGGQWIAADGIMRWQPHGEDYLREMHSAYNAGERSPEVVEGERIYQRQAKARARGRRAA